MATEQQLLEQYNLTKKQQDLSQSQLEASYKLAQEQLNAQKLQEETSATRLAQQAYIQREQSQRVAPNILSAMGTSNTGYENIYGNRLENTYKGQYGDIIYNRDTALANIEQNRATKALSYEQSMQQLALERESASLDYKQALENLRAKQEEERQASYNYPSSFSQSQINANTLSSQLVSSIKNKKTTTSKAMQKLQDYYVDDYMEYKDYINAVNKVMRVEDSVVPLTVPATKLSAYQKAKLNKALAVGGR